MTIKERVYEVIFEADTRAGKTFDIIVLLLIALSVFAVMLESVEDINSRYNAWFKVAEFTFTTLFVIEYVLRLWSVKKPIKYALSFFGVVDLLSILPAFLSLFLIGGHSLIVIRSLRLLRVFRIFKLVQFLGEASLFTDALRASRAKIIVFIGFVLTLVIILGTVMYMVESSENGFTSIPRSVYWAIVTLTTVGYGDIAPSTVLGQVIASVIMILGYGVLAVPTGIVTNEFVNKSKVNTVTTQVCPSCVQEGHDSDAVFCKFCGEKL